MSRDEIIAMAKDAGFFLYGLTETHGIKTVESDDHDQWAQLARFAALVAAKEREVIAAHYDAQPHVEFFGRELADEIRARGKP